MYRRNYLIPILAAAVSLSGILSAESTLIKKGRYWVGELHHTFKVQKTGKLIMDDVNGDVTIETWDRAEVEIHEIKKMDIFTESEAQAAMTSTEEGYVQEGNTIRIGGPGFNRRWIQSHFIITVPKSFFCDIGTQGGDITVTGLEGDMVFKTGGGDIILDEMGGNVNGKTGGGDIDISGASKSVEVATGGGDIDISSSRGRVSAVSGGGDVSISDTENTVDVRTGGGDVDICCAGGQTTVQTGGGEVTIKNVSAMAKIQTGGGEIDIENVSGPLTAMTGGGEISAKTIQGETTVRTGGGSVDLEDVQGPVSVQTGGGSISVEVTLKDFSKDHRIDLDTGGGDIDLAIPASLPASIHAVIKYRHRQWEEYEITSDFPLKISSRDGDDSRYKIVEATGDINGGGDPITLNTHGGDIHIEKID